MYHFGKIFLSIESADSSMTNAFIVKYVSQIYNLDLYTIFINKEMKLRVEQSHFIYAVLKKSKNIE